MEEYAPYPDRFLREVIGLNPTPDQTVVADLLATNDKVSVKSGNGPGKSCLAGGIGLWFLNSYRPSILLTTAPTERQVKGILWREIRRWHGEALYPLEGKVLKLMLDLAPNHFALGFSTKDVQQMQGFHSPNIMVIVDEANGFPEELFDAIFGMLSGGERKILFMIGNPLVSLGKFFDSFSDGETKTHTMSCLNHPNVVTGKNIIPGAVTREWVERQRKLWGEDSAFWQSRVLGNFPKSSPELIFDLSWIETAEQLKPKKDGQDEVYMGHDPGEYGGDDYVWYIGTRRKKIEIYVRRGIEPNEAISITKRLRDKHSIKGKNITIDGIGAGATIYSVFSADCEENDKPHRFVSSETAKDNKTYEDKGAESWFHLKEFLNPNAETYEGYSFDGKVDRLKADLCTRKLQFSKYGRYMLEPKPGYRLRMKRSPNYADAMALCYNVLISRGSYGIIILPDVIS